MGVTIQIRGRLRMLLFLAEYYKTECHVISAINVAAAMHGKLTHLKSVPTTAKLTTEISYVMGSKSTIEAVITIDVNSFMVYLRKLMMTMIKIAI